MSRLPDSLGALRRSMFAINRPAGVKDELRRNLIARLREGGPLFRGVLGYEDTVMPQIVNAILARHNFILLGLRGQAKSRILRALVSLLDEQMPVVAGSEVNDDPFAPISKFAKMRIAEHGEDTPIAWVGRDARYVEKLATPDVTVADIIGDVDPIKAARGGHILSDELTIHYGMLPRANRGIFALNELPDLAGKVQVGLFNIMQEGDVQIKGYPVRLSLDVLLCFTANPEDYTARGKIITPLKDRIGAEIRTHYMQNRADAIAITSQEAWVERGGDIEVPRFVREVVEEVAFQARSERKVDKRSGVSQRLPISVLETAVSNAERRALATSETPAVARVTDIYAALPSMTGKFELEYEGELKGADQVARDLVRAAVSNVFDGYMRDSDLKPVIEWFDLGGALSLSDTTSSAELVAQATRVQGLIELAHLTGIAPDAPAPVLAAGIDFALEGLYAQKKIGRSDERGYFGTEPVRRPPPQQSRTPVLTPDDDEDDSPTGKKKKKYYN